LGLAAGLVKGAPDRGTKRDQMAGEGETRTDMQDHKRGYSLFVALMKWGTIVSAIIAFIVVFIFIA
jgi:hypothetical protein